MVAVGLHRCLLSCFLCCITAVICLLGGSSLVYQAGIRNDLRVRTYRDQQQQIVLILPSEHRGGGGAGGGRGNTHQHQLCNNKSYTETNSNRKDIFPDIHVLSGIKEAFGTTPEPDQEKVQITRFIRNDTYRTVCAADDIQGPRDLTYVQRQKVFSQIIVDDERKFLYCFVPKVACSNWKRVIKYMQGNLDNIEKNIKMDHRNDLVFLEDFSKHEIQYRLRNYYKFMFVRNPMERLLSAYRNKFGENIGDYRKRYGPVIVKRYRSEDAIDDGRYDDITFEEFIRLLIDMDVNKMDSHWRPMTELCQPCAVNYDFIGSFEHLQSDAKFVLDHIKGDSDAYFPKRQGYYKPTTQDKIETALSTVNPIYLQQLIDKYILDFILFGYSPPKKHTYKGEVYFSPSFP